MRKGAGISGLSRHTATTSSYSTLSTSIAASQLTALETSLSTFKEHLLQFARNHRADIRKDPAFRHQFQKMCAAIGVDPLAGSGPRGSGSGSGGGGGWWTELLGLGEWQFELAVQVVDVCVSTREMNGGMISMEELIRRINRLRGIDTSMALLGAGPGLKAEHSKKGESAGDITSQDILKSLELLRPLHAGYTTHSIAGMTYIRSVPQELDTDQSMILVLASEPGIGGKLTEESVRQKTGWSDVRARTALEDCVMREGLGWVDEQELGGRSIWVIAAVDLQA